MVQRMKMNQAATAKHSAADFNPQSESMFMVYELFIYATVFSRRLSITYFGF